jgi:hypothetical protein
LAWERDEAGREECRCLTAQKPQLGEIIHMNSNNTHVIKTNPAPNQSARRARELSRLGWGVDELSGLQAARFMADPKALAAMADDLVHERVKDPVGDLTQMLLLNKQLPLKAFTALARWARPFFGYLTEVICRRPDAPSQLLDECAKDEYSDNLFLLAQHSNASRRTVLKLAENDDPWVVGLALEHPNFPRPMVDTLAASSSDATRAAVAYRTEDPDILTKLAADQNPEVRADAVENPATPAEVVSKVALTDADEDVVAAATRMVDDTAVLDAIAERVPDWGGGKLKQAILQNPHSSDLAKTIAALSGGK